MSAEHTDIGAYSLGLLDQRDRRAFEDHLASCATCGAELAELGRMSDLLAGVEPVPAASEPPVTEPEVIDLLSRRAAAQRRRSRGQVAAAAAAGIVLLAGGAAAGIAAHPGSPSAVALAGQRHSATAAGTGVTGTVGLVSMGWGTQVTLDLSKVRGPLTCELISVSRTGQQHVVLSWRVPRAGYGVPGHPAHLLVEGGTPIPRSQLAHFVITVAQGPTLLTIPV
jgi:putative zinc finger protein